jgi:glucose-1-phosphate adenylyltransferase
MKDILTIILGGGQGTRLSPLTKYRAKPAVPIGGKYRLIDIPLSNCVNSGISKVFVLTQFMSVSLNRHIGKAFAFDRLRRGFVDVIPASQSIHPGSDWFQGTADAVRKSMLHFKQHSFKDYLILSGDHLYRMNYRKLWNTHKKNNADLTIATMPISQDQISDFGIMQVDENDRIKGFIEKPKNIDEVTDFRVPPTANSSNKGQFLASMGIYIFKRKVMQQLLNDCPENDFGYNIVPNAIKNTRTFAFRFNGYWEDIGKINDFFHANIGLTRNRPVFSFYDPKNPIFTRPRTLPGTVLDKTRIDESIITEGCQISNSSISQSIIGIRSIIGSGTEIRETMMMGSDYYEGEEYYSDQNKRNIPKIGVGSKCRISRAIIDKNARIGNNVEITAKNSDENYDGNGFVIRNGITVIEKNAVLPSGMRI